MTKNYEKCKWKAEYVKPDCLWRIVSPLGIIVTRCYNKKQVMTILLEIANEEPTDGKEEETDEEKGLIF